MAKKPIDYKNLANIHGTEVTGMEGQVDRREKYKTIFDQAIEYGIDLFEKNSEDLTPEYTDEAGGLVKTYLLKERAHLGLTDEEYETHKGVIPQIGNERAISFKIGGEKAYPAVEYDPIADIGKDKTQMENEYREDMAREVVKQREIKYVEQAVNSGLALATQVDLQAFYDSLGLDFVAPATYPKLTVAEFEQYVTAHGIYYRTKGVKAQPVMFVSPADWANAIQTNGFQFARDLESIAGNVNYRGLELGIIHGVLVVPYSELGVTATGVWQGVYRFTVVPGNAYLQEQDIREIGFRKANLARVEGAQTLDAEVLGGTYQQAVWFKDNFKNEDGSVESFTNKIIVSLSGRTQDSSKVIAGTVHGAEAPSYTVAKNRSFAEMVEATYDNTKSGKVPLPEEEAGL